MCGHDRQMDGPAYAQDRLHLARIIEKRNEEPGLVESGRRRLEKKGSPVNFGSGVP